MKQKQESTISTSQTGLKQKFQSCVGDFRCLQGLAKDHHLTIPQLWQLAKKNGWTQEQEELAALKQKQESAGEWTESNTGMKFRRIPGGSFRMGSPSSEEGREDNERQHTVRVGEFWLGETEVTLGQFSQFVRDSGHRPQSESSG